MTTRTYLNVIFTLTAFMFSCTTTKVYSPTLAELQAKTLSTIPLKELLQNKVKYQGQIIETEGELIYGFEDFSLHYYDEFQIGDKTIRQQNFSGLGLELHHDLHFDQTYLKNLNDKLIRVKGVFDTMNYEKLSGLPDKGLLKNVFYFQPVDR
jgi:hypothetical protein